MRPDLTVNIAGLKLRNPTMVSSGVLGLSGLSLSRVWDAGVGAVVSKSLGLQSRKGYSNPTIVDVGCGILNAMGLPNPGVKDYINEIKIAKSNGVKIIIGSIYGSSPKEFSEAAKIIEASGVNAVELNLSCPNVESVGLEIGQDPNLVGAVVTAVKQSIRLPVFAKLTPNTSNIKVLARAAETAGVDGLVAINTVRAMAIDIDTGRPILSNKIGGLSGPAIKPIAVRCVYEIAKTVKVPIIGCGGIMNWKDVVEFLLAGASAV
ncbi:dihydroorotate dehydrogenase, partial [Candidatus Bathyarchaeota archaeon]|nr:dihydroorotate dehydrogenase [Candidatus Bathyarchaeota archaeon]